jgi:hypothetical protein
MKNGNKYGNNTEGGYQAIYLMDFYVGGHHIFKVGMSANPHMRNREIASSLFANNKENVQVPLYRFIHNIIHWEFKSVWYKGVGGRIENTLLDRLKQYTKSLNEDNNRGGRVWNKFSGMYEAYTISSKHVGWMTGELEKIVDREVKGVGLYIGKSKYDGHFGVTLTKRN